MDAAAIAAAYSRFPGITNIVIDPWREWAVIFSFPGGRFPATWSVGEETILTDSLDVYAWNAYRKRIPQRTSHKLPAI